MLKLAQLIAALTGFVVLAGCSSSQSPTVPAQTPRTVNASVDQQGPDLEVVMYRPSNSTFFFRHGSDPSAVSELAFGAPGDVPLWADFSGSGKREPGVYRHGVWMISTHADGNADITQSFGGAPGDIPLAGDIDGDGKADLVIFRAGEWIVRSSRDPSNVLDFQFGQAGDIPLLADFNGDGKLDLIVFRRGQWFANFERNGKVDATTSFGGAEDQFPVPAFRGLRGRATPALFRDGHWLVDAGTGSAPIQIDFGGSGDIPVHLEIGK